MKLLWLLGLMAIPSVTAPAAAQWGRWETLGTRQVNAGADRDTIRVRGSDRHRQLRICVTRRPIRLYDLDVRFANGGRQDLNVRSLIRAGSCTRPLDLRGRRRDLRTVHLAYAKVLPGARPTVIVQAR